MPEDIRGKVVIVTGAATGIGRAAALEFASLGAKVAVVTGHNRAGGEDTVRVIREAGGEASFVQCDVSDEAQVKAMVDEVVARYGRIDCAFNNAGVGPDGVRMGFYSLTDLPVEVWDKNMEVNARGCFLCMKYEIPAMLKTGGGAIVNTAGGTYRMTPNGGAGICPEGHPGQHRLPRPDARHGADEEFPGDRRAVRRRRKAGAAHPHGEDGPGGGCGAFGGLAVLRSFQPHYRPRAERGRRHGRHRLRLPLYL